MALINSIIGENIRVLIKEKDEDLRGYNVPLNHLNSTIEGILEEYINERLHER